MSTPLSEWVATYARNIANELGLKDWQIVCHRGRSSGTVEATTEIVYGRKLASIWFRPRFFKLAPEDQRICVLHEFLHCHVAGMAAAMDDCLDGSGLVPSQMETAVKNTVRRAEELAVDGIATAIAPFFPLPPTEEPKDA